MFDPDKRIFQEIEAKKGGDLSVFLEISVGDTIVHVEEGDSLLAGLTHFMAASAAGRRAPLGSNSNSGYGLYYYQDEDVANGNPLAVRGRGPFVPVSGSSGSDPMEITLNTNQGLQIKDEDEFTYNQDSLAGDMNGILITKVQGNTALNDWFQPNQITWTNNDPARVEVPVTETGNEDFSNAVALPVFSWSSRNTGPGDGYSFAKARLEVGLDSTANVGNEPTLRDPIRPGSGTNQLQYNPLTVNEPVINLNQQISTIELTREVRNESGSDVNIREIGLWLADGYAGEFGYSDDAGIENYFLISRDLVDITVPDSQTVSISYKIRTSSQTDAGIMTNFNEMLYRHLANTTRVARDINNNDQNDGPSNNQFKSRSFGGALSNLSGVMLGTSDQAVDEGNTSLGNRVALGQSDGQLYRVGSYVSDYQWDGGLGKSYFDLVSFFENRGSTTIDVKESGWITNGPSNYVLVARALTGSTQSINPGDLVEARFRVSLQP